MQTQHAVIVGGSSGIGLATAAHLRGRGFRVTIAGRDPARLAAAASKLGEGVAALVLDAQDAAAARAAFAGIGAFDHLVLALGSGNGAGPFASVDVADVRKGLDNKLLAHFGCAQAALPHLRKDGSITFVSAVSAQSAMPGTAGLAAINAGIAALVPVLAVELRPLRVNTVSPGVIDTPWWDFLAEDAKASAFAGFAGNTPVGRVGTAEDVAQAIGFLVGNGFTTGHALIVDGGLRLAGGMQLAA